MLLPYSADIATNTTTTTMAFTARVRVKFSSSRVVVLVVQFDGINLYLSTI